MMPDEIRQMPKFRQLLVVTDTAPPVKAAYPPIYLRRDIQKPVVYVKPETLRLEDTQVFGGNFLHEIRPNDSTSVSVKPKKASKKKNTGNQSAVGLINSKINSQNDTHYDELPKSELDFAVSEITDYALGEIGGRIRDFEMSGAENFGSRLALANDQNYKGTEDFMQQELKTILTDEDPKTTFKSEHDPWDEEIVDCFDIETVLQNESAQNSAEGSETNREITLSASSTLTDEEIASEKTRANKNLESENEFNNSLALRVL